MQQYIMGLIRFRLNGNAGVPLICHHLSIAMDSGKCYDKLWHFVVHTMVSQRIRFVPGVFGGHALRMMRAMGSLVIGINHLAE